MAIHHMVGDTIHSGIILIIAIILHGAVMEIIGEDIVMDTIMASMTDITARIPITITVKTITQIIMVTEVLQ